MIKHMKGIGARNIFIEADSIASNKTSGIGNATSEILRHLDKLAIEKKLKVTAIVPYGRRNFVSEKYQFNNVHIRSLPPGYKYVNYVLTRTSIPLWPDMFFGRGVYIFPNYKTWSVPFSKAVTFIHDIAHIKYPHTTHPKNLKYLNDNFGRWLKRADVIATISDSSKRDIEEQFPKHSKKIVRIHLGVDTDFYKRQDDRAVNLTYKALGIPKNCLLYVGSIEPRKNILTLLDAYKRYSDQHAGHPKPLVLIGGDGWNNTDIKYKISELIAEGYQIKLPEEYVEDSMLPAVYSGAFALVHVAIYEGFGLSLAQAMACGLPVITANNSSMPEVVGNAGLMVDANNAKQIANAIARLENDQVMYGRLQEKGMERAKELSWLNTVKKLLSEVE